MIVLLIIVTLANSWIWKIAGLNFILSSFLILTTVFLYLSISREKYYYLFFSLFIIIAFFQWETTTFQSFNLLDNDEQRIQKLRLEFYKPSTHFVRVIFYRLNLKDFLEGDFTTATTRIQRNFFETIDPNVYFFGGHPRERVWANDFEKFPYILIIPFLMGGYSLIKQKKWLAYLSLFIGVVLLSLLGHKNSLGPFILFPSFVVTISSGLLILFKKING